MIYITTKKLWDEFDSNHNVFVDKGIMKFFKDTWNPKINRKFMEIKKLFTEYRKQSVSEW